VGAYARARPDSGFAEADGEGADPSDDDANDGAVVKVAEEGAPRAAAAFATLSELATAADTDGDDTEDTMEEGSAVVDAAVGVEPTAAVLLLSRSSLVAEETVEGKGNGSGNGKGVVVPRSKSTPGITTCSLLW